ncbi:MAG TPA: TetR/AcrR family transcriptional regulator [Sphingobacteriaceae bacterium]
MKDDNNENHRGNKRPFPRNKELTKQRFLYAVGHILRTEGFTGLGVNNIERHAMQAKRNIYDHFGTPERLIEEYIFGNDYWISHLEEMKKITEDNQNGSLKDIVTALIENQFAFFSRSKEMQEIILWEISQKNDLVSSLARTRELEASTLLEETDGHFENSGVNFRAVSSILISAIYYLVLHAKSADSTFCGVDIRSQKGMNEILATIKQMLGWAFEAAEKKIGE